MAQPLISVIVPVYKVEAYLDKCVSSITGQTYQNLEIILVDDGSPDNCPAMCDEWAKKDSRIQVIHKKNGGLSDARNAGLAVATGQYIGFVDSDDYIAPEMYQLLWEHITADQSDIAACGIETVFEDHSPSQLMTPAGSCVLNKDDAMKALIQESWLKQPVWYKLYKAEMIRDILFPVGKYHEDVFWSWQAVARAERVSVFETPCYFYLQRGGSIMAERYSMRRLDAIEAKQQWLHFLEEQYPPLVEQGKKNLLFSCMYHGQLALRHLGKQEKRAVMARLREAVDSCAIPKNVPFVRRCWLVLAKLSLSFACRIRNLLRIGL